MAKLIEKKQSQTTYNIDLTEEELHVILTIYGSVHYDFYNEKSFKYGYSAVSKEEYSNLHGILFGMVNDNQ